MQWDIRAVYRFDRFVLDLDRGTLLGDDGSEVALRPKAFAMLQYFVENAERLIDRDELMRAVWPDVIVSEDSVSQCIAEIRRALDGDGQRLLRTVQRRGYRFAGPIAKEGHGDVLVAVPRPPAPTLSEDTQHAPDTVEPPAIAVLPFQNMSGDAEQDYFADGMVEDIITGLSRIRWLRVIARNSTFIYKGRAVDIKQVGHDLGARYVLEGSVRRSDDVVRITAQLINAIDGAHLWAEHYDEPLKDVFALQDKIAIAVAGVIEPTLQAAEAVRSTERSTHDLTAYDLYLRGYAIALSSSARFGEALELMEQAIARDDEYGPALSFASICYFRLVFDGRSDDPAADEQKSVELARRALRVAPDDPAVMAQAANVLLYFGEDAQTMTALVDRAMTFSPSFARGWYISGTIRVWTGQTEEGIRHIEKALSFSPRVRVGWVGSVIGIAHFLVRRFEEAVPKFRMAIQDDPSYPDPYRFLAACYAHMGRLEEARAVVAQLRSVSKVVIPTVHHLRIPEQRDLYLQGLRLAADERA
jgi:TolB-like protein